MNGAGIEVRNGLGDKCLDIIGFCVFCKYMNYIPYVKLINNAHWGNYESKLFNFSGFTFSPVECKYFVNAPHPSTSLGPFKLYERLKRYYPKLSYQEISEQFNKTAKEIVQPSDIITSRYPIGIEKAYGIHLRKSDKVSDTVICNRHMTTTSQFDIMINSMLNDIKNIIDTEEEPVFFVCSEQESWKEEIIDRIKQMSPNKPLTFLIPNYENPANYENFVSVLDMFCLSQCRTIFQSVKYSTFSILASLLGNNKLMNYSHVNDSDKDCLIHTYVSTIEINNKPKNYEPNYFFCVLFNSPHSDITTNIEEVYSSGL